VQSANCTGVGAGRVVVGAAGTVVDVAAATVVVVVVSAAGLVVVVVDVEDPVSHAGSAVVTPTMPASRIGTKAMADS
jgi:hypothetical protein